MLLIESGTRMHTTGFEWPKSMFPSGFAIKVQTDVIKVNSTKPGLRAIHQKNPYQEDNFYTYSMRWM